MLVAGTSRVYEAFQVAPGTPDAYWTVVDGDFMPVALADDYLRELRLGRRRTVSTTKAYAENLALFLDWTSRSGCAVENGPRELGRFVHWLRSSPVERRGTGFGPVRSGQRINTILVSVRELYKHAVSMGSLDGRALDALYVVGYMPQKSASEPRSARWPLGSMALAPAGASCERRDGRVARGTGLCATARGRAAARADRRDIQIQIEVMIVNL